jgi:uncharacterized repeat protein (TIGR01451 family)
LQAARWHFPIQDTATMNKPIAVIMGTGLLLLLACTRHGEVTTVSTNTASATTATPTHTSVAALVFITPTLGSGSDPSAAAPTEPVTLGRPLTYTLTITNYGPSDATGVVVTDTLPTGMRFVSATPSQGLGCLLGGDKIIICALNDLALGASATITFVVTPITVTGTLTHTALVKANESDPNRLDNRFYEEIQINPSADLSLRGQASAVRSGNPSFPIPRMLAERWPAPDGNTVLYTLTITNSGPSLATGLVVTAALPAGMTPLWSIPPQPLCGQMDRTAGCYMGVLEGGDSATITLDISTGITPVVALGTSPPGLAVDISAPTCAFSPDVNLLTCHLDDLESGAAAQVLLEAAVDAVLTGTLTNVATVGAHEVDSFPWDNRIALTTTLAAATPLTETTVPTGTDLVLRAVGPDRITAGSPFTFTFTITNVGLQAATGVEFHDTLPPGLTLEALSPNWPVCTPSDGAITCHLLHPETGRAITLTLAVTSDAELPPIVALNPDWVGWPLCDVERQGNLARAIHCSLAPLAGGDQAQITFVATAGGVLTRIITNTATVEVRGTDLNDADNRVDTMTMVDVAADLAVQSLVSGPAIAGTTLDYSLTVTNHGPSVATGVVLTAVLPLGVNFVSVLPGQGGECLVVKDVAASPTGSPSLSHTVICDLAQLARDEAVTVAITIAIDAAMLPPTTGAIINSAIVRARQFDPDRSNNQVTQSTPVTAQSDLSISDHFEIQGQEE